jgi:hypothetical protein
MHLFGKSTAKKPTSSPADAIFKLSEQENVAMLLFQLYSWNVSHFVDCCVDCTLGSDFVFTAASKKIR